jgi:signal transduction histidine kinase
MHFDDRLATVLRHRAAGERAARTQFRQLLDLLGSRRHGRDESLLAAAWLRLGALGEAIAAPERAEMVREPGLRFRNPELALHLAEDEPEVAAAALSIAQLDSEDWEAVIPRLPVRARGFLRLRRDLPTPTQALLERLGIQDRGLPRPAADRGELDLAAIVDVPRSPPRPVAANDATDDADPERDSEIGALVKRIEAFRRARGPGEAAPRLPLDERAEAASATIAGFAFTSDAEGRIDWADASVAAMVLGATLAPASEAARQFRQPLRGVMLEWAGAPHVSGEWVVDAAPRFSDPGGHFLGYAGRFRRPAPPVAGAPARDPAADRMRQVLHELRTPVNAIQGFAEVIQQQLFGPVPHEYRALAAGIASDAARMLAGFEELDRLARLESGALDLDAGESDFAYVVSRLVAQLQDVLRSRTAGFALAAPSQGCSVALTGNEAEALAWRLLATLTGAVAAGEELAIALTCGRGAVRMRCELPALLAGERDVFGAAARSGGAVSAGMFGAGFALRLARAEAQAAGGDLVRQDDALILTLPLLTALRADSSHEAARAAN